jgi:hypothetical protein
MHWPHFLVDLVKLTTCIVILRWCVRDLIRMHQEGTYDRTGSR